MEDLVVDRTIQLIRKRFSWLKMGHKTQYFISNTCVLLEKTHNQAAAPLLPISSSSPLDIIGVDFLHLEQSSGCFENIFLITSF